ncbi:MAG: hypothetical protein Q7S83_02080 [bacterium]|nr:hypothetical protein [bacterium]
MKLFALLLISAPVFAQDTTFAKENPNLKNVEVEIFLESSGGDSQSLIHAVRSYEEGDLVGVVTSGIFALDFKYTHKYGADGKIAERTDYVDGKLGRVWVYTYNEDGSWELNGYSYDDEGERSEDSIYVEKWNDKGNLLTVELKLEGYKTVKKFSYNKDGKLVKMEETPDGATKPISWEVYEYTDAGKLEKKEVYSGDVLRETTSYNDRGDKKESVRYDEVGKNPVSKSVYSTTYADLAILGERKTEDVSTSYAMKNGQWVKGGTLRAKLQYFLKK